MKSLQFRVDFNIEFYKNLLEVHYMLAILHFFSLDRRVLKLFFQLFIVPLIMKTINGCFIGALKIASHIFLTL